MLQPKKRPDTPLADSPTPDYRNIPTSKREWFKDKPYTATAQDSAEYRKGFERGTTGKHKFFPTASSVRGYQEAKERKLLPKNKK